MSGRDTPFHRALVDGVLEEFSEIPGEEAIHMDISQEFKEECQRLVLRTKGSIARRVRQAILIAAVIGILVMTAVAAPGPQIVNTGLTDDPQTHYENTDSQETPRPQYEIKKLYLPSFIPVRYRYCEDPLGSFYKHGIAIWHDAANRDIVFSQGPLATSYVGIDDDYKLLRINGFSVKVSVGESKVRYTWDDGEYVFCLDFDPDVTAEERYAVFDSIRLVEEHFDSSHMDVRSAEASGVVDEAGNADIHVQVEGRPGLENTQVTVFLQKKVGLQWERVDIGTENDEWVASADGQVLDVHFYTRLEEKGEYRVVAKYVFTGSVQQAVVRFASFTF